MRAVAPYTRPGADCVVTAGGIQSNHARATAVAARYLGLEPHLILRTSRQDIGADPGLVRGRWLIGWTRFPSQRGARG